MNLKTLSRGIYKSFFYCINSFREESENRHKKRQALAKKFNPAGSYLDWLYAFHQSINPSKYVEIGVAQGKTLQLANEDCEAIGIDPSPKITSPLPAYTKIFNYTSDSFFNTHYPCQIFNQNIELAFIDGLHEYKQATRDIINTAQYCSKNAIILVHDIVPPDKKSASPIRKTRFWPGDVYKTLPFLSTEFPKLHITIIRAFPTGLAVLQNVSSIDNLSDEESEDRLVSFSDLNINDFHDNWLNNFTNITEYPTHLNEFIKTEFLSANE